MKMTSGIKKFARHYMEITAVILISVIPRFFGIQRYIWKDELISLRTLGINVLHNPLLVGATTNLPLFFYILKFFHLIYNPPVFWIYRFISVVFGVAVIAIVFLFLKKELNRRMAWFSVLILAMSPLQIYYSQELRPYALVQFLIIVNAIVLYRYTHNKSRKNLVFFALSSFLIVLTHYTGYYFLLSEGFLLVLIAAWLLYKKKPLVKRLVNPLIILFISGILGLFLLYLMTRNPLFVKSVSLLETGGQWDPLKNIPGEALLFLNKTKEVLTYYYWFGLYYYSVDPLVQMVFKKAIALVLIVSIFFVYKVRQSREALIIFSSAFILFICLKLSYLGEKFGFFLFGGRHVMPYSPFLYILIAYPLSKLKKIGIILLGVLVLIMFSYQFCFVYGISADKVFSVIPTDIFKTCILTIF